jgi:MEMO1 family protein
MSKNLLMAAITPHPPIIIPEVGGNELKKAEKTVNGFKDLCKKIMELSPETVVIITPHSVLNPYYFSVYSGAKLQGNFARFRAPQVSLEFNNDIDFIKNLKGISPLPPAAPLDHGSLVPLYYLNRAGYKNNAVVINYTALGAEEHKNFGRKIVQTAEKLNRNIIIIASGDLSHNLFKNKDAHKYDELIVESIKHGDYNAIENITIQMRDITGECAHNSLLVALGALGSIPQQNKILSYEAPFGVGYIVGIL